MLSVCAFVEFECGINWMIAWFLEINFDPRLVLEPRLGVVYDFVKFALLGRKHNLFW